VTDGHHRSTRAENSHRPDGKHFDDSAKLIAALILVAVALIVGSLIAAAIMR